MITNPLTFGSLLVLAASAAIAQGPPKAIGQPRRFEPYGVLSSTVVHHNGDFPAILAAGIHKPVTNPSIGLFGIAGEFYLPVPSRFDFSGTTPGVRALMTSRVLGLSGGIDFDITGERNLTGLFSFQTAIRRGGLLGRGTMLRLDWYPWRDHELSAGIHLPIAQPFAGRTRSRDTDVDPPLSPVRSPLRPATLPARAEAALTAVARAATMILAYTNLFAEDTARVRYGESFQAAMRSYDDALAEAFRVVAGSPLVGDSIVRRARAGLLDAVLLPYDSLFGQVKEHPKSIRPLTVAAHASFLGWLKDSSRVSADAQRGAATVHSRWLETIEAVHAHLLNEWKDSRLVWLPLQLALTEADYDEQSEVDALVARAVGRPFTDHNALTYLRSSDLPLEIARSIFAARDYHVLWTHDFTGQRADTKTLDEVAYAMVADAYLPALTRAVQRYDSAGGLTQFYILLDQFYYGSRNGRLWMDILENPLRARIKLPGGGTNAEREIHLRTRQLELHNAVSASRRLQQAAAANGGDRWLRTMVRVHVNIVLPTDFSFRSHRIVPPWPFVPDNIMRDHRKMVFYDITESDSYRGAVMLMGVGIGEHYASPTWEDRGYRVRGPAALEVREAVRRALRAHRVQERDIPLPLRADGRQPAADSSQSVYVGRALQVHNEAGFGAKESSVARAMLYNLAPPGSVVIVPDPIWVSETWAAMLAGAAARGCKVYVIAPSAANNPNPHAPIEAMENFVMSRLLDVRHRLADQMRRAGGELRVGLYTARAPIDDVAGRTREVKEGLRRSPWLRQVIPFDDATLAVLDRAVERTEGDGKGARTIAQDEKPRAPQLHQKTQLIARPGAIQALVRQPGWQDRLAQAMRIQSEQTATFGDQFGWTTPAIDSAATRSADAILWSYEQGLSAADRKAVSFYFSTGTQNMDPRGLMSDGEATLVVSGVQAAAGLVDLYYMMARSTWIEQKAELDRLLPLPSGFMQKVARMIRYAL